jgi:hypothetical protein
MKKRISIFVSLLCLTCSAMAEQRIGPFLTGAAAVGEESGSAFGGGLKYEWLINENIGIDLHAGYMNDGEVGHFPLEFGPVVAFPLETGSLTLGAGGLCGIPEESGDAALGFYASVGVRGPLSFDGGMEAFAELQYVDVSGDDLDYSAVELNIGILWVL